MKSDAILIKESAAKVIMEELNVRHKTQIETWVRWYKGCGMHRFEQPVGKQYTYGKGPESLTPMEQLQYENQFLKQQIEVLKK